MTVVLAAVISSITSILLVLGGWFGGRALKRAMVGKTDAETRKTDAEAWQLLTGGQSARITNLERENEALRARVTAAEERAELAEETARQCRVDLDDLRRRYDDSTAPGGA